MTPWIPLLPNTVSYYASRNSNNFGGIISNIRLTEENPWCEVQIKCLLRKVHVAMDYTPCMSSGLVSGNVQLFLSKLERKILISVMEMILVISALCSIVVSHSIKWDVKCIMIKKPKST